jgi:hypothetical protein
MKTLPIVGLSLLCASLVWAQRGTGEEEGLARRGADPERVELSGTLAYVRTAPCERSTGNAYTGTHLFITAADGQEINLHVGPAEVVQPFADTLTPGTAIAATAFRTDRLGPNEYVAMQIRTETETFEVRRDDLSPFWARQRMNREERREWRREMRQERLERRQQLRRQGPPASGSALE